MPITLRVTVKHAAVQQGTLTGDAQIHFVPRKLSQACAKLTFT